MKIAGHTMGTPEYTVTEAIKLFHDMGIDGAEIVLQDGYCSGISAACTKEELDAVRKAAEENGIDDILVNYSLSTFLTDPSVFLLGT